MSPAKMSKIENGVRVALRWAEAFNRQDAAGLVEGFSPEGVYEPATGLAHIGPAAVQTYWQKFFTTTPKPHLEVEEVFGLGLRAGLQWRCSWLTPAGESQTNRGVEIFRFQNNLIIHQTSYTKS